MSNIMSLPLGSYIFLIRRSISVQEGMFVFSVHTITLLVFSIRYYILWSSLWTERFEQ